MKLAELELIKAALDKLPARTPAHALVERHIAKLNATANYSVNAFKAYCTQYGLKQEHLGAKFSIRGWTFEIVGLNPGAPKYAIEAKRLPDGKQFRIPPWDVKAALGIT